MDITYLGHSSFRIRGKTTTVVTDPFDSASVGLKFPKHIEADIITLSHDHDDHNAVSQLDGTPFVIRGAGEYEVKGVGVVGISVFHDEEKGAARGRNTMYRIEVDGVSIVHLGDLGHTLTSSQVDDLDGVNVLLVPTGGVYTINPSQAVHVVNEIEPSIVIPMHYGRPELNQKAFGGLAPLADFLKEIGKADVVPQAKLTLTKDKLPAEMQVVVLE
jgi:L-ascorbate metabolism protein UlaG (beta-lactamase superfamily)